MFLMKFSYNQQNVTTEPMLVSYADLVDFHSPEEGIQAPATTPIPVLDQVAPIHDDKELPEWYSTSMGPLDKIKKQPTPYVNFYGNDLFTKDTSTKEIIAKAKTLSEYRIQSEHAAITQHLMRNETNFFTNMRTLSSDMYGMIGVKKQAIDAALNIYFHHAFKSLQYAKSNIQEKILKSHTATLADKPLTAFEYSIMCCLSKLDFVFDKSITNLSDTQKAYVQALANDNVSGEDNNLFDEAISDFKQYEAIIKTIQEQILELITVYNNNDNYLSLAGKLNETIEKLKTLNAEEKINKPIYIAAEIAMQEYCTSLIKDAKTRESFINDSGFNSNDVQSMALLNGWISNPEFFDAQSKLRHEIWEIFFQELIDDLDVLSYARQSLIKAARNLPGITPAYATLQAQQPRFESPNANSKQLNPLSLKL